MKNIFRSACMLALLFCTIIGSAQNETREKKRLLVICSYSPVRENSNQIISMLSESLQANSGIDFQVEYMDSESMPFYDRWRQWMQHLFTAYSQPPDAVVIIGQEAWSAYRNACIESWKPVPVILGGVKKGSFRFEDGEQTKIEKVSDIPNTATTFGDFRVTGYYTDDYFKENFQYMRRLQPGLRHIIYFYDDRYRLPFIESYLQSFIDEADSLQLHYLPGSIYSTGQLLDSIRTADSSYAFLSGGWYTDANRYPHAYSMLLNELKRYSCKAVYQLYNQGFHAGSCVGGYFVSGKDQGKDLAGLVGQVLTKGIENSPTFRITPSAPMYYIDYRSLGKLPLDKKGIPDEAVYINRPHSFFENHPKEVLAFSLIILFFAWGIILILLYKRHKTRSYQENHRKTQQLLQSMPNMVTVLDSDLVILDIINPLDDVLMGLAPKQLIGHPLENIEKIKPGFANTARLLRLHIEKSINTRQVVNFNYQAKNQEETFHIHTRIVPIGDGKTLVFLHNITDWVRTEQEILKLKVFLQSVIDHLPLPIFVKNVSDNFRYLYYNDKVLNFYGGKLDDFLGKNDFETNDPLAGMYREEDLKVLESDGPLSFERIVYDDQGRPCRWGVTTKTRLLNPDGTRYIIAILTETTEQRKREMELHSIRNELSLALEAGSLSAWLYTVRTRTFTTLYGQTVSGEKLTFEQACEQSHPDQRKNYVELMEALSTGKVKKKKEILRFKQGDTYGWFETHAMALGSGETGEVEYVIGTQKDITQEVETEEKLQADKFKSDLAIRSSGIMQWDYDLKAATFTSPNQESFIYRKLVAADDYIAHFHPDDRPVFRNCMQRLVRKECRVTNAQLRQNRPGIGYRWVEIHCVAFKYDEEGNLVQITGLLRDITEMKKLTDELAAKEKAEELNRLKSAFLANMSHEIRTPLNAIVGFSNLITQTDDPAEQQEFVRIIETNNELLLQLVNDILDLSKIEAGQLDFVYSDIDIIDIFSQLEAIYRYRLREGVTLSCCLPDRSCIIRSEKNRLTQVLSNFLSNACKFTSTGHIKMGYEPVEGGLRFYVADTGRGIAPENLPHVFERFAKFDNFIQGTGLGLSICQTIVQHLQGEIGVDSTVGKGSTFWFTIPCEMKNRPVPEKEKPREAPTAPEEKTERIPTILVAEDNDSNFLLIAKILGKSYRLVRAVNGKEAVEKHKDEGPDLILMDIKMPETDGVTATRLIRQSDRETPIIALTAQAFETDKHEAMQAGCNGFLTKPLHISLLKSTIHSFLK